MSRRHSRRGKPARRPPTQPAGTLRVIGGRFRGTRIQYLGDPRTRPMKQRVREAAFNLLGERVSGAHVVDLFAGTGALTWEAFSRGAASATLVERHFPSVKILHANAAALDVAERIEVEATDTFFWSRQVDSGKSTLPTDRHWLVFCSPPYEFYVSKLEAMLELIRGMIQVAPDKSLVLVESDRRFQPDCLPNEVDWDVREYAPAVLARARVESSGT